MHKHLLFFAASLLPLCATAQTASNEKDAMLFLESVALMKKAEVCSIRLQGFKSRFEPALEKWRTANTVSLKNGEQFLRTAASVENKDFNMHVNAVTDIAAQLLNQASQAILEENCRAMLQLVGSDG